MGEQVVVVGVDGSPASYTALRWALAHAARIGAQVHAVRCWAPVVARRWEAAVTGEPVPPEAVQEARAEHELAQVVAAALAWVPAGPARVAVRQSVVQGVVRGSAGPVLIGEADGAALLVVGHGPRVTELRHRSVSWYCLRHATCPVLVIPPTMATRRTLTPGDLRSPRNITAPVRPISTPGSQPTIRTTPSRRRMAADGRSTAQQLADTARRVADIDPELLTPAGFDPTTFPRDEGVTRTAGGRLQPMTLQLAETTQPSEIDAPATLVDRLPQLTDAMDREAIPLLGHLDQPVLEIHLADRRRLP